MDESGLYEQILDLDSPWYVEGVDFDRDSGTVLVSVKLDTDSQLECPTCSKPCPRYDSRSRRWRHLDTCQFKTIVECAVPRVECPEHGCLQIAVPWATARSRFTSLFESQVTNWLQHTSIAAVCREFDMSWNAVDGIMKRAVARGMKRRSRKVLRRIGVDEISIKKGHRYVTIVSSGNGDVIDIQNGRSEESLSCYYSSLTDYQKRSIEVVTMDMSRSYVKATLDAIPDAEEKICFDRFHVAKIINEAVDKVRKFERLDLSGVLSQKELKGNRFLWLRNQNNLDRSQKNKLNVLSQVAVRTGRAWLLKELAASLWNYSSRGWAERGWMKWYSRAIRSRLDPIKKAARTVKSHLWGIINAVVLKADNALAESINSKIKMVKIKARGFRNIERYKTAIYFHCGGLNLHP